MDAVAEPEASVVYCEWTLEFKNVSGEQREARAQIALPPGAVVSRLTLWINGEEREAAFGGRSQVREAYQQVAVVRRRDPVLVTTCGPDRILMQCFPVPARGGVMKVRLGITAPLVLESPAMGRFAWPQFIERNFGIPAELNDALWIESSAPVQGNQLLNSTNAVAGRPFALRASVADSKFSEGPQTVVVSRRSDVLSVWSPTDANGRVIQQDIEPVTRVTPARLVVVVDGSARMRAHVRDLAKVLSAWPATNDIAVLLAADTPRLLSGAPQPASAQLLKTIGDGLSEAAFTGGQDNLPALEQACALAAVVEHGAVLWIHETEPVLLSTETALRQQLERAPSGFEFFELQTGTGPDRIVERLDGLSAVRQVPRFGSVGSDITRLLAALSGKTPQYELSRKQMEASQVAANGTRGSEHITRLWARDEATRLTAARDRDDAVKLATGHQIVTPLTGAVVLESQQQYSQHDLKPVDPKTVPVVPEPASGALIVLGVLTLLARRFAKKA